ncbi:hypothetical protein, partial [Achromobacter sp.]|uniref:hypothetical protein n=1 Tax=Achromobacter sp. TaxID=134375 RepID=UPI0028AE3D22
MNGEAKQAPQAKQGHPGATQGTLSQACRDRVQKLEPSGYCKVCSKSGKSQLRNLQKSCYS